MPGADDDPEVSGFQAAFGGVLAYILLLLYAGSVFYLTDKVYAEGLRLEQLPKPDPAAPAAAAPKVPTPAGLAFVITTVGGLVSALVIAKLTQTKAGETPRLILSKNAGGGAKAFSAFLVVVYLLVWLAAGLTALIVGLLRFPDLNSTLADIGTGWLGLAVVAGYAYFGLKPPK